MRIRGTPFSVVLHVQMVARVSYTWWLWIVLTSGEHAVLRMLTAIMADKVRAPFCP